MGCIQSKDNHHQVIMIQKKVNNNDQEPELPHHVDLDKIVTKIGTKEFIDEDIDTPTTVSTKSNKEDETLSLLHQQIEESMIKEEEEQQQEGEEQENTDTMIEHDELSIVMEPERLEPVIINEA